MTAENRPRRNGTGAAIALMTAIGLTYVFWRGLWHGGGLIGADTYTYNFPQKAWYAERLAEGELPLWNRRTGHGYPLLAESQTGVFYPVNLVVYGRFELQTAYNVSQLFHYVLVFLFTWLYARRLGLGNAAALFAGLVFTYGWFPCRVGLEWAVVTGAWFPAAMWCAESFAQTRWWRYAIGLALVLGVQMLAGHFNLAFLTQLTLLAYVPARLWFAKADGEGDSSRMTATGLLAGAMLSGFALAAVQLLPTWELKQLSQRAGVEGDHDPGYGHTPVWYWSQAVVPWLWYGMGIDLNERLPEGDPGTNDIEAHLYFGLIPLVLLLYGVLSRHVFRDRRLCLWLVIGFAALLYTPGWFVPVTKHLPGFSFFIAPGRYSLIVTFAVAIIAAAILDRWLPHRRGSSAYLVFVGIVGLTVLDLWWVAGQAGSVTIVDSPPIRDLDRSELREIFARYPQPVRLFSRGPNLPTLLGVSSTPEYLGIGPSAYYDPDRKLPGRLPFDVNPTPEQIDWLRRAGVTHVLSFKKLDTTQWPATLVWSGFDRFLNRAWARREPLYLYELHGSRGRVAWVDADHPGQGTLTNASANRVTINVDTPRGGRLILTELAYPGWRVTIDGEVAEPEIVDGMYRAVDVPAGRHEVVWAFRPTMFRLGMIVSIATLLLLAAVGHVRFWHPGWFRGNESDAK